MEMGFFKAKTKLTKTHFPAVSDLSVCVLMFVSVTVCVIGHLTHQSITLQGSHDSRERTHSCVHFRLINSLARLRHCLWVYSPSHASSSVSWLTNPCVHLNSRGITDRQTALIWICLWRLMLEVLCCFSTPSVLAGLRFGVLFLFCFVEI